ncbi:MAG: aspartate--tRNA ligase, partial [Phycisphaeraceae bacterium]|nr:aspartate--tRNA ligase [Phycisphaeraceae bacterium]
LRDREGLTQLVFRPSAGEAHDLAERLRHEDVIEVTGVVEERGVDPETGKDLSNPRLATGKIEVAGHKLTVLNKAATPPFTPDDAGKVNEELRLRYRFLDLRRPRMQSILKTRHRVSKIMRDYFDAQGFYEIETPFLCRSTPEGARDFLVPSRLQAGAFYALPQSPQLFKQILMTAGMEKYFQIVRCFRDEDPRADRQAEFTQLDLEMSFVSRDQVMGLCEGMVGRIWKEILDVEVPTIRRMTYAEAMGTYGSDRPDLRFELPLKDITDLAGGTEFKVFQQAIEAGGMVKAIVAPGGGKLSRKQTDELANWIKQFGVGGMPVTKVEGGVLTTGIAKFVEPIREALIERTGAGDGDLICFGVHSNPAVMHRALGELRLRLAQELQMIPADRWEWLWVIDFPLVEFNPEQKRWDSLHHPFTAPHPEDVDRLTDDPASVRSLAYDLVLNGSELGGGSIRIHSPEVQQRVFELLGIDRELARVKFGFLLDALRFGTPPHGGIAFGLDRVVMHLCGTTNIRDVIAFPKTQMGADLMTEAPSQVDESQLRELRIRTVAPEPTAPGRAATPL